VRPLLHNPPLLRAAASAIAAGGGKWGAGAGAPLAAKPAEEGGDEDQLAVPLERSRQRGCCVCQDETALASWLLGGSDGARANATEEFRSGQKRDGGDADSGLLGGGPSDDALWLLSCVAGSQSDEIDSTCVGFDDQTVEVGGVAGAPSTRREAELAREELFTEREVAMAAGTWARVSRLRSLNRDQEVSGGDTRGKNYTIMPGDLLQALPGVSFLDSGVDVYRAGDEGTVTRFFQEESTGEECVEITWARTGRKSGEACPRERFRFIRRQVLTLGDLLQALPGRECVLGGVEHCRSGDEGTVSRFRKSALDGEELVEVTCARTGKVGTVALGSWMEAFRFVCRQVMEVGDTIRALPSVELQDLSGELYRAGEEGIVTCLYREVGTGEDRMEVMWLRSGRKSDESARWMRWFRLVPRTAAPSSPARWPNRFSAAWASPPGSAPAAAEVAAYAEAATSMEEMERRLRSSLFPPITFGDAAEGGTKLSL